MSQSKILKSKYQIIKEQDSGTTGKVYKSLNLDDQKIVAVKEIPQCQIIKNEILKKQIKNEIENLKKMKSANVIQYIDDFEEGDYQYLVTEFCDGQTLENFLIKQKTLPEKTVIQFFIQILNGLKDLHKHNIIHRDLKLANIMITNDNIIKLIDFGSSRELTPQQQANTLAGTALNMAPQIMLYHPYGREVDIFSLGVILYQLLFGDYPFKCNNLRATLCTSFAELAGQIQKGDINFKLNNISITENMQQLIKSMLAFSPENRIKFTEIYNHTIFISYVEEMMKTNRIKYQEIKMNKEDAITVYNPSINIYDNQPSEEEDMGDLIYKEYFSEKQSYETVIEVLQKMTSLPQNIRNRYLIFILCKLAYVKASILNKKLQDQFISTKKTEQLGLEVKKSLEKIEKIYSLSINELKDDAICMQKINPLQRKNIEKEIFSYHSLSDQFQQNFQSALKFHQSLVKEHLLSLNENDQSVVHIYLNRYFISFIHSFKIFENLNSKDTSKLLKDIEEIEKLEQEQLLNQSKIILKQLK